MSFDLQIYEDLEFWFTVIYFSDFFKFFRSIYKFVLQGIALTTFRVQKFLNSVIHQTNLQGMHL